MIISELIIDQPGAAAAQFEWRGFYGGNVRSRPFGVALTHDSTIPGVNHQVNIDKPLEIERILRHFQGIHESMGMPCVCHVHHKRSEDTIGYHDAHRAEM